MNTKFCSVCGAEFESATNEKICLACQSFEKIVSPEKKTKPEANPAVFAQKKKILVIDDDKAFIELITNRLMIGGYEVIAACHGEEGFYKIENERPDLVILDILMPHKSGYDVLKQIKKETNGIEKTPVIIMTGKGSLREYFDETPIHAFMMKPFDAAALLSKIEELIALSEKLKKQESMEE